MLLNSLFFIFAFLPVVLFLYYVLPAGGRNLFLLAASLMFYAWGDPVYLILLIFSTVFHYVMGQQIGREAQEKRRQKLDLLFAAGVDVFLLCFFKYFGPAAELLGSLLHTQLPVRELALPIGLSFYTFKNMSYLFDIYYGRTEAEKNFTDFAAYGAFFPVMTAGPIVRYEDVKRQIKKRRVNALQLGYGARRFILGLAKKVLLADTLASLYGEISAGEGDISVLTAWIGMFAFTMEIYFDFSGYSDMAIGISRMRDYGQGEFRPIRIHLKVLLSSGGDGIFPGELVQGLHLYTLGRQPRRHWKAYTQYPYCLVPYRNVARSVAEFSCMGALLRHTSDRGKIFSGKQTEKTSRLDIRGLHYAVRDGGLDAVLP